MKRKSLSLLLSILLIASACSLWLSPTPQAWGMEIRIVTEFLGEAGGWEKLSPTASTGVTSSVRVPTSGTHLGKQARAMLIAVEDNPIRFKLNGDAPTATDGIKISAGQNYTVIGVQNVRNFRCIDTAAGASAVHLIVFF